VDETTRQQIALFRYGLIADLVHRREGERGLYALLRQKAERAYEIPGSRRTRVALDTLRDWLAAYRCGGFEALYPKPRRDRGHATRLVAFAAFALAENTSAFLPVLQQAILRRGIPKRLYVDSVSGHRIDVARFEHLVANLDRRRARETSPAVENLDACARKALFSGPGHGLVERALEAHQLRPIDGDASGADPFASQARDRVHRFGRANQHLFWGHNL
jgi:hypothetical protein